MWPGGRQVTAISVARDVCGAIRNRGPRKTMSCEKILSVEDTFLADIFKSPICTRLGGGD